MLKRILSRPKVSSVDTSAANDPNEDMWDEGLSDVMRARQVRANRMSQVSTEPLVERPSWATGDLNIREDESMFNLVQAAFANYTSAYDEYAIKRSYDDRWQRRGADPQSTTLERYIARRRGRF